MHANRTTYAALAGALLAGYWALAMLAVQNKSTTSDEIAHLTAGSVYWRLHDFRLQPENGNLPQRWCALPVVLSDCARLPGRDHPGWLTSNVWQLGDAYFHELGNPLETMLWRARAFAALFGVGVALVVWRWSRQLFGERAGLVSLLCCVFCPTMLAHGPLATSDMCLTLFLLLSLAAVWRVLHRVDLAGISLAALAIAGLFASKVSAGLIVPMAAILVLVRCMNRDPLPLALGSWRGELGRGSRMLGAMGGAALACALVAWAGTWAACEFRFSACSPEVLPAGTFYKFDSLPHACELLGTRTSAWLGWLGEQRWLPESYLYGVAYVLLAMQRQAFCWGEYSVSGWWYFFPLAFLVKTSWPLWLLALLAAAWHWPSPSKWGDFLHPRAAPTPAPAIAPAPRRRARAKLAAASARLPQPEPAVSAAPSSVAAALWYRAAPLWALWLVYWSTAVASTLNIGHRHLLPIYPVAYIFAGSSASWLASKHRLGRMLALGLMVWLVADSLLAFPHYLAYFNPLVPRQRAYQYFVDSSLDWGQDLPGLRDWLAEHNPPGASQKPLYLTYFGTGSPQYYGIRAASLPPPEAPESPFDFQPGLYAISATALQAVYEPLAGRWTPDREREYRILQAAVARFGPLTAEQRRQTLGDAAVAEFKQIQLSLEYHRYLRLLSYLRHRDPEHQIGYSILIFELSEDELQTALEGPPRELAESPSSAA